VDSSSENSRVNAASPVQNLSPKASQGGAS
jgi:hypothetical protein